MKHERQLHRAAWMAAAILALAARPAAAQAGAPVAYTMTVTVDSGGSQPRVMTERVRSANGRMRVDFVAQPAAVATAAGMYMLMDDASDSIVTVMPSAFMMSMRSAESTGLPPGLMTLRRVGTPATTVDELGDGPTIDGLPTRHYRVTIDGLLDVGIDGTHCQRKVHSVADQWNATGIELPDLFTKRMVDGLMRAVLNGDSTPVTVKRPAGAALRGESVLGNVKTSYEVSDISHAPIDRAVFERPAGFTMMDPTVVGRVLENPEMRAHIATMIRERMCTP